MYVLNIREIRKIRWILEKKNKITLSTSTSNWKYKGQREICGWAGFHGFYVNVLYKYDLTLSLHYQFSFS